MESACGCQWKKILCLWTSAGFHLTICFVEQATQKRFIHTKELLASIYPSGGDLARTCMCQWLNESEKVLLEVQACHPCRSITSKLCQWHIMFDLPCPLSLAMAGGKDRQGH